MKKIIFSLLAVAATINVMAVTYSSRAMVTLTSADNKSCNIIIAESNDLTDAVDSRYCAEMSMDGRDVALYVVKNGTKYQNFAVKSLNGIELGVKTNASTSYKLTVSKVSGAPLTLKVGDELITLTDGLAKDITLAANQAAASFGIFVPAAPAPYEICHRYGKLQITSYPESAANVVVKDEAGAEVKNVAITDHVYQEIDLTGLAAGHYTVEANGQTLTISVQ